MATDDGYVTPELEAVMADLAEGRLGLLIAGHAYVRPEGRAGVRQLGIYADDQVPGLASMVRAVHDRGGVVVAQLAHAGLFANTKLTGRDAWAFSVPDKYRDLACRTMTPDDIATVVDGFGQAARRAMEAGFDGVQIHAAHGYLLSQSLSPFFNRRGDDYGGPLGNRARTLLQVLTAVRAAVGADTPVLVKMNCEDFLEGGLTLEEATEAAAFLEENGIDAIEVSGGTRESGRLITSRMGIKTPEREAYFREQAGAFKSRVSVPVILVGGVRSLEVAGQVLAEGAADYLALCRPLIREPHLVRRWAEGDRRPATCLSDNLCYKPARSGEGIHCVVERREHGKP
jgi:2,4-dienoyl-CoA reductase-like NADH-dependent reductase (Old Yellow Enzyme family)